MFIESKGAIDYHAIHDKMTYAEILGYYQEIDNIIKDNNKRIERETRSLKHG